MKVYIAAPYTSNPEANTRRVIRFADVLAEGGLVPFIPHLYHTWHQQHEHDYDFWCEQGIEWLKSCDLLIRLSGESKGADKEVEIAKSLGIPVVFSTDGADNFDNLTEQINRVFS